MRKLNPEETKGTRTYYLPLQRGPEVTPQVTLVVTGGQGILEIGTAVCSQKDNFSKRYGRWLAFSRLHCDRKRRTSSTGFFVKDLGLYLVKVNQHRPGTISDTTIKDLKEVASRLKEAFNPKQS